MRKRNILGIWLTSAVILAGLATPAHAEPSPDTQPDRVAVKVEPAAGTIRPAAFEDCRTFLCLWDNENYTGTIVPNRQSGNLGSYQDRADSFRNTTGYWIVLYVDANYRGPCIVVPRLGYNPDMGAINPVFHDSISSVQYFQYESDAVRACLAA